MSLMHCQKNSVRSGVAAFAIAFVITMAPSMGTPPACGQNAVDPDTPVSSDGITGTDVSKNSSGADSSPSYGGSGTDMSDPTAVSPSSGGDTSASVEAPALLQSSSSGSEVGSQVSVRTTVSHEQEKKDRLFVDATSIAVSVILLAIALFLFLSLPKSAKKTGNDNLQ
ncbi:MAG TPA: hypothetical protein PKZ32_07290 [Candidatus Melainabacteria bacterium]|nr:hypothetical protein [Candidatus Melainabacteria bacterium]